MYDRFEILNEIRDWEDEIERLSQSSTDETEQIKEIRGRIASLEEVLKEAE